MTQDRLLLSSIEVDGHHVSVTWAGKESEPLGDYRLMPTTEGVDLLLSIASEMGDSESVDLLLSARSSYVALDSGDGSEDARRARALALGHA